MIGIFDPVHTPYWDLCVHAKICMAVSVGALYQSHYIGWYLTLGYREWPVHRKLPFLIESCTLQFFLVMYHLHFWSRSEKTSCLPQC